MKSIYFRTIYTLFVFLVLVVSSCNKAKPTNETKSITDTDRYYSALSAEKGRNAAFMAMFDSAGVTLAAHKPPIEGIEAIKKILLSSSDSTYILTWKPLFAKVAASAELGYTYGTYKLTDKKSLKIIEQGTYTTIWQKNSHGEWKAVMDTGNEGLE